MTYVWTVSAQSSLLWHPVTQSVASPLMHRAWRTSCRVNKTMEQSISMMRMSADLTSRDVTVLRVSRYPSHLIGLIRHFRQFDQFPPAWLAWYHCCCDTHTWTIRLGPRDPFFPLLLPWGVCLWFRGTLNGKPDTPVIMLYSQRGDNWTQGSAWANLGSVCEVKESITACCWRVFSYLQSLCDQPNAIPILPAWDLLARHSFQAYTLNDFIFRS